MAPNIITTELYTNEPLDAEVVDYAVIKGDKGDKGDTGLTPAFSIGEVTTLDYNQPASANITGTDEAPVLNLGIPKGEDAYTQAVEGGYTGGEEEFNSDLANIKTYAYRAEAAEENAETYAANASASASAASDSASSAASAAASASGYAATARDAASDASGFAGTASTKATEAAGSAATAEQAATTATQKASDASASATAADGSASSASASATAAGNAQTAAEAAQTAAETAQGKAEDAQEAAETAAASVAGKSAQIDQNTAGLIELRSALDTKAGRLVDTVSGSVASFVPDSTVPNLLGLSVALEPIQDLHGYDSPWPAGGGKNKFNPSAVTFKKWHLDSNSFATVPDSSSLISVSVDGEEITITNSVAYYGVGFEIDAADADRVFSVPASVGGAVQFWSAYEDGATRISTGSTSCAIPANTSGFIAFRHDVTGSVTTKAQLESGSTASAWTPYENICPISGRESVEVEATGINIWDEEWENGYIDGSGMLYEYVLAIRSKNYCMCKPNTTYYLKKPIGMTGHGVAWYTKNKRFIERITNASIVTAPNDAYFFKLSLYNYKSDGRTEYLHDVSLNYPSTDTVYHAGHVQSIPIPLGQTVYGGTLDVTAGTLTVDRAMVTFDGTEQAQSRYFPTVVITKRVQPGSGNGSDFLNSHLQSLISLCNYATSAKTTFQFSKIDSVWGASSADELLAIFREQYEAGTPVQICYPLATPITIDLDPVTIATIANQTNNVWADAGDVTVEFAADLKTYIDNKIAAAVAALS